MIQWFVISATVCVNSFTLGFGGDIKQVCIPTVRLSTSSIAEYGEEVWPLCHFIGHDWKPVLIGGNPWCVCFRCRENSKHCGENQDGKGE